MTRSLLPPAMEPADLVWHDGVPASTRFGDVYFSREDGLAETRYVFIGYNRLSERFAALTPGQHFVVAETGFGTGLNFLATWAEWLSCRPGHDNTILHFVSVERYPLTRKDLEKALSFWPEVADQARELMAHYPPLIQGTHRLVLAGGRVRLTLFFGDVLDAWRELSFVADAWFLDGFAPSLNPEMWLEEAISQIRRHSQAGTTLATFTSVGRIRRALAGAGFSMSKVPGFGRKRDMLAGALESAEARGQPVHPARVAILGAGIAGTTLARNLADRGVPVTLIDKGEAPGAGASGNPQGALYAKLGVEYNAQTQLAATALSFSQRYYKTTAGRYWHPCGLLQLAADPQEQDRQQRFLARNHYPDDLLQAVDAAQGSELAGLPVTAGGLWFPDSGWLEPARACRHLARHPQITPAFGFCVTGLEQTDGGWLIRGESGRQIKASVVVIAAGPESAALTPVTGALRLKPIRGQISYLPAEQYVLPDAVICGSKYLNPPHQGMAVTGATFDLRDNNPDLTPESHEENLAQLIGLLPAVCESNRPTTGTLDGRVSFRCTTHDYQPVADELRDQDGKVVAGAFLLTGYGSKGLTWAPLLAEYLADRITGQPLSLPEPLTLRIASSRLHVRASASGLPG
ncbi:MAG TPA: bifunctional tRNA (5-methylaminomethyl-2-thiouridine)(34)-methyltransferase MnmD/FAD-dependent 5-carboxymethylaminomethyl-2-thiouridine(34) oxidoreductase MnmC [Marinobacter sp.]|nr:bifunctional tRNA (5-methylaminomethyl-2-thiouridine)(34)-methyltransferase MnmD/FAD-dependent 5-carboxymethylaminomethyl-2-thiouridine(34) oxidoreductase MnmC [Marinobacter sp.]